MYIPIILRKPFNTAVWIEMVGWGELFDILNESINKEATYLMLGDDYELSSKRIEQIIYNMQKEVGR